MLTCNHIRAVVGAASTNSLAGPNPNRVGLILNSSNTGTYYLSLGETPASEDCHFRVAAGIVMPLVVLFDKPCDWIKQTINVFAGAAMTINLVEIMDVPG